MTLAADIKQMGPRRDARAGVQEVSRLTSEAGRESPSAYSCFPPFFSLFLKGPSPVTFHIDGISGTLQQLLLKYFSALEAILYFHVALVQEFPVTQEQQWRLG